MRIQSSIKPFHTNQIKATQKTQQKINRQLASGKKVSTAADNAAVLSISQKMLKQIGALSQGQNNIQSGVDLIKIADGAMSSISESIGDLEVNAVRAMNGTMSASDRSILQQSNRETLSTIDHLKSTTKYNEMHVLDGSGGDVRIHTGTAKTEVNGVNASTQAFGLADFSVEDADRIDTSILDHAMYMLSSSRSRLGAQQNGLEAAYRTNQIAQENTVAAESRMTDTDMFQAIMQKETNRYIGAAQMLMLRNQMQQNQGITAMF